MLSTLNRKLVKTAFLLILLLLIITPPFYRTVFDSSLLKGADELGISYVDEAFDRALLSFALARASNAIISVIQDSEINIAPAGIGVTIAIGEALDPVNDMIERFSWVMLISLVSLSMQKLLIEISPWFSVQFILLPALIMILAALWCRNDWPVRLHYYGRRLVFAAILIRFCIPAVAMVNEQVYSLFLNQHYTEAVSSLEQGNAALRNMNPLTDDMRGKSQNGIWEGLKKNAEKVGEIIDLQHRISRMKSRLSSMIENLLKMIAIFVLNTVILPIGFLWLLARLYHAMTAGHSLQKLEQALISRIAGERSPVVTPEKRSEAVHPGGDGENVEIDKKNENIETDQ